jgi:hypothetical protein
LVKRLEILVVVKRNGKMESGIIARGRFLPAKENRTPDQVTDQEDP